MTRARRKARSQPHLTADRVREEALRLIEDEGLEGFSTRKLGRALGVEAMAIYWYYPSKEALLDAVVELLIARLGAPGREPLDFIDAMRRLAHSYRELAHAYPKAFPLLATRRFATAGTYSFLESLFTMAEDYGFDARATARWFRLVANYCNGAALDELAGERETSKAGGGEPGAFPHLAKVSEWLAPKHYEQVFSFGLEVLLDAISKAKPSRPAAKPSAARRARKAKA